MSVSLFVGRIHCLHPSRPLNRSTPVGASNTTTQASPPNAQFAIEYLVQSCGISSEVAVQASKYIHHLKSADRPDAVLQYLRQIGVRESEIRSGVSRYARILCSSVEKILIPNVAKLREVGLSMKDIAHIISRKPALLTFNIVPKVDFWEEALGSREYLLVLLKSDPGFLYSHIENVAIPNLSFLQDQCGLSIRQIVTLLRAAPRLITYGSEALKLVAERADKLGCPRSSRVYLYALIAVSCQSKRNVDARLDNLKSRGLSQEEVNIMIRKRPTILLAPEELLVRKLKFLLEEACQDKLYVVENPSLLLYSLENRLIPRIVVRKLLFSARVPIHTGLYFFMLLSEERFLEKFIRPYEHVIPDLHQAYLDAFPKNSNS